MTASRAARAAHNNATWCDAVCRAHGIPGRFSRLAWWNERRSPPFYPNLVTLSPSGGSELDALVRELRARPGLGDFGVKDSFCRLDLAPLGFARLFEASWVWRAPGPPPPRRLPLRWARVAGPAELAAWEAAWWRGAEPGRGEPGPALFPAALLEVPGVELIAGYDGERLVAGCALTRSGEVVGLSCVHHGPVDPFAARSDMVSEVLARHPGRPLAGYESGPALEHALGCGFEPAGPLRVWLAGRDDAVRTAVSRS